MDGRKETIEGRVYV
jgi:hypothetical protein